MNKKIINTILILLLVVIWGLVFNKFFNFSTEINNSQQLALTKNSTFFLATEKDTFDLKIINRDPFLGKSRVFKKKKTKKIISKKQKLVKKNITSKKNISKQVWPKLKFFGFVKKQNGTSMLCLIKVNNKFYKKREREQIGKLVLKKVFKDSLVLEYKGEIKTIKKAL